MSDVSRGDSDVGLYGGTFNPIHRGHLVAAGEVADRLGLREVRFIPSWSPPHKAGGVIAPAADRLEWVRLAVAEDPRFVVDPIEVERGGASFLVDTLEAIGARMAPARPVFLVGSDAFREMGSWRAPRELFALAHYAVMNRPPEAPDLAAWIPEVVRDDLQLAPDGASATHRSAGTWVRAVSIEGLEMSASAIRARLREGRSIRYWVPEAARAAIEACPAYRSQGSQGTQGSPGNPESPTEDDAPDDIEDADDERPGLA